MRAVYVLMLSVVIAGCPNRPDREKVGALSFSTNLTLGCEPVEIEHEVPGPAMVEVVRLFRQLDNSYENIPRYRTVNGTLLYGGKLEPISWARLDYFKPVFVVNFLGVAYVLEGDGALQFKALLKEYGKLPIEITKP